MPTKDEILKERLAKAQAQKAKYARQAQALTAKLAKQSRAEDTHRKILEGVTALYGCAASEEYRRLHEQFRARVVTLPKDRALFGLPPLPPELIVNRAGTEQLIEASETGGDIAGASLPPLHIGGAEGA